MGLQAGPVFHLKRLFRPLARREAVHLGPGSAGGILLLLDLQIEHLPASLVAEAPVLRVDFKQQILHQGGCLLVRFQIFGANAEMQRLLRFLLLRALSEPRPTPSQP